VTVALHLSAVGGRTTGVRAAATFLADRPIELRELADVLGGVSPAEIRAGLPDAVVADAALAATDRALEEGAALLDDTRASAGYRRAVVGVLAARAAAEATGRLAA
jgi:CO/xanthine dehydrogenase FAD-binding subunit